MFEIYDDKVYFVAETPDINKVIEIFPPSCLSAAVAAGGIEQLILLERNFDSGSFSKKRRNQNHTK